MSNDNKKHIDPEALRFAIQRAAAETAIAAGIDLVSVTVVFYPSIIIVDGMIQTVQGVNIGLGQLTPEQAAELLRAAGKSEGN